jgi:DNA-binding response OmpR family regulator
MLTARGEVTDRIVGLELGADDYLPKPFEPRELLARIQSILRRSHSDAALIEHVKFIGLEIDKVKQDVIMDGTHLSLSTTEYEALLLFIENAGETLDREFLVENLRGISWQSYDRSVDVLVSRLRSKLGETPRSTRFIKTIHGVGYKFIGEPDN